MHARPSGLTPVRPPALGHPGGDAGMAPCCRLIADRQGRLKRGMESHVMHFYSTFVQIPPNFGESSVNLHDMRRFRRFFRE